MRTTRTLKAAFLLSVVAIMTIALSSFGPAFAQEGDPGDGSDIVAAAISVAGGGLHQETLIQGNNIDGTKGRTFKTIATQTVTIPRVKGPQLLTMDFSGASACFGPDQGFCTLRILVNGELARPEQGFVTFDSTNFALPNSIEREAHAISAFSNCLPTGAHTVEVQIASQGKEFSDEDPFFSIADWVFEVERMRGCR